MREVLRRLIATCVLLSGQGEAPDACGIDQLCGGSCKLPALFVEAIDDGDYRLEVLHLAVKCSGLALPNTANSATPNQQARVKMFAALSSVH